MALDTDIAEIERQILALPKGTIVRKRIKGYTYPYLQWRDASGKVVSRYLSPDELEETQRLVDERKTLEARLARLLQAARNENMLITQVSTSTELLSLCEYPLTLRRRWLVDDILSYLATNGPRVCVLYGLRRTGKTIMMRQVAGEYERERPGSCAYLLLTSDDTMDDVVHDLRLLEQRGVSYVFLDEVTAVSDFTDGSAVLADLFASKGMRIILAGTDSLGFWLAEGGPLYDRAVTLHTTRIPFAEFSELLGVDDVDEYICHGGTLLRGDIARDDFPFADWTRASRYVDTAIAFNIQNSLAHYRDGYEMRNLAQLYDAGTLTSAINRVIQSMNHQFTLDAVRRTFRLADLGDTRSQLRTRDGGIYAHALDGHNIDTEAITEGVMRAMDILEAQEANAQALTDAHLHEISLFLQRLDVLVEIRDESLDGPPVSRFAIALPGIRYAFATELVAQLEKDPYFSSLPRREQTFVRNAILDNVRGRILEDVIMTETSACLPPDKSAFKLGGLVPTQDGRWRQVEYDVAIYDERDDECSLIEVKHSTRMAAGQLRHLADDLAIHEVERKYGRVVSRTVVYRGAAGSLEGVSYVNAADYLRGICRRQGVRS